MRSPFVFQTVSKYGTSNPIVARLVWQSHELLKWIDLTDVERAEALKLLDNLHRKLIRCYDCLRRLHENNSRTLDQTKGIFSAGNRTLPFVIDLEDEVESFLMAAKQYLRDIVAPFNKIYRASLKNEAAVFWDTKKGDDYAPLWAEQTFGPESSLATTLRGDAEWIGELVKKRNAVEHPGKKSGTLVIENYQVVGPTIAAPRWRRDVGSVEGPRSFVIQDLETYLIAMLELAEDIVAGGVKLRPVHEHIQVYEIPENQRNPANPIRLTVSIDEFLQKRLSEANKKNDQPSEDIS